MHCPWSATLMCFVLLFTSQEKLTNPLSNDFFQEKNLIQTKALGDALIMVSETLNRPEFANSTSISMWAFKVIIPLIKSSDDSSSFPYQIISKEPAVKMAWNF